MTNLKPHVVVLGGGISGLVSALRLLQSGHRVTLLEESDQLGGLGGTFEHEGFVMEKFYHVMLNTDSNLLPLLKELNLHRDIRWKETKMGFLHGKRLFPFNTPMDLLKFGGLSIAGRLRTAIGAAYIAKFLDNPKGLDSISAIEWLEGIFGEEVSARLWRPLLRAKFGDLYESVPAYWFWSRMRREKSGAKEVKGYVKGGYRRIADRLETEIRRLGGVIRKRTPVYAVQDSPWDIQVQVAGKWESYDAAISTVPMPILAKIARGRVESSLPSKALVYQGVVNAVVLLKNRLQPNYWNAIVKKDYPFQGLVETTHVVPVTQTGGRHLVYLLNYCQAGSETYNQTDGDIRFQALKCMKDFNPRFQADWVEDIKVFRTPYVEAVWPLGYKNNKPRIRLGDTRLYLANTAQCYPDVNSWNTMVGIANDAAGRVEFDIANVYKKEPAASMATSA
ncbi:MAG: FAD-dependent oxidoreductase [Acidobacteria bacterium]|nr:FAD-dependent oxidoreductase [Acidobacteriota bacterium]